MKIESLLKINTDLLDKTYRHRAILVKGGRIISSASSSLGGCRYLGGHFGRSCHAEINVCKTLPNTVINNPRKVAKVCYI